MTNYPILSKQELFRRINRISFDDRARHQSGITKNLVCKFCHCITPTDPSQISNEAQERLSRVIALFDQGRLSTRKLRNGHGKELVILNQPRRLMADATADKDRDTVRGVIDFSQGSPTIQWR